MTWTKRQTQFISLACGNIMNNFKCTFPGAFFISSWDAYQILDAVFIANRIFYTISEKYLISKKILYIIYAILL